MFSLEFSPPLVRPIMPSDVDHQGVAVSIRLSQATEDLGQHPQP
jgi:hypothetical protein